MYCIIPILFHLVILWRYSITTKIICIICFSIFIHYLFLHSRCLATSLKKWHLLTIIFYSLPLTFFEITSSWKPLKMEWAFHKDCIKMIVHQNCDDKVMSFTFNDNFLALIVISSIFKQFRYIRFLRQNKFSQLHLLTKSICYVWYVTYLKYAFHWSDWNPLKHLQSIFSKAITIVNV